ncbi:hypothetical protein [Sulfurimonas sp.]|uniref:hypothetical protein n=1 Tax=Sulfurimonas sp. TaxID=2022749 RepID=UPI0026354570|nr:hypothetical protein [Sulfurimonas sp.]MDD5156865.1 hypothetical protein [Sulfurimonas sp.]
MDKLKIIESVKKNSADKTAFSLKLPSSLKDDIQKICIKESISMNSLIVAVLSDFVKDDDCEDDFSCPYKNISEFLKIS